jgi:hypothetical protein
MLVRKRRPERPFSGAGQNASPAVIWREAPIVMHPLSEPATRILDRMEPDRVYQPDDLRVFVPDTSVERLREIMHELWIHRRVERVGYIGWRCHQSASPGRRHPASTEVQAVKPEDLFDHATFEDFFK